MPKVVVLEKDVADKIAAGEVVDRPVSVVKELVENSIDAGATRVEVELEDGGKRRIAVTDNGCGMSIEDAVLALERHATSKIRSADDLFSIRTLGFRGEALPSIAAVAHLRILTRAEGEETGIEVRVERGEVTAAEQHGAPQGTQVTVSDLFYNVPARQKFLKAPQTELSHIVDLMVRFALSYPAVAFKLSHNGRPAFAAPGSGDALNTIVAAYGREVAKEMTPVASAEGSPVAISGFVSRPSVTRSGRSHQSFFINGRLVRSPALARALDEAYRGFLPAGRYPVACLFVTVDPASVDVNVHPTKMEVRFAAEREVFDAAHRAVRAALERANLAMPAYAPRMERGETPTPERVEQSIRAQTAGDGVHETAVPPRYQPGPPPLPLGDAAGRQEWTLRRPDPPPALDLQFDPFAPPGTPLAPAPAPSPLPLEDVADRRDVAPAAPEGGTTLPELNPVARVLGTYVVCEAPDAVYIIDQHAAHERILYDALLQRRSDDVAPQQLLIPVTLSLSRADAAALETHRGQLAELGFEIEPFGRDTFVLRAVPMLLVGRNYARVLQDVIDDLREMERSGRMEDQRAEVCATVACHSVTRSGDALSPEEMRQLVRSLRQSPAPYTCAHGRPTMLVLSRAELEKKIGRG